MGRGDRREAPGTPLFSLSREPLTEGPFQNVPKFKADLTLDLEILLSGRRPIVKFPQRCKNVHLNAHTNCSVAWNSGKLEKATKAAYKAVVHPRGDVLCGH